MVVALCNWFQMANKGASQEEKTKGLQILPKTRYVIDCPYPRGEHGPHLKVTTHFQSPCVNYSAWLIFFHITSVEWQYLRPQNGSELRLPAETWTWWWYYGWSRCPCKWPPSPFRCYPEYGPFHTRSTDDTASHNQDTAHSSGKDPCGASHWSIKELPIIARCHPPEAVSTGWPNCLCCSVSLQSWQIPGEISELMMWVGAVE